MHWKTENYEENGKFPLIKEGRRNMAVTKKTVAATSAKTTAAATETAKVKAENVNAAVEKKEEVKKEAAKAAETKKAPAKKETAKKETVKKETAKKEPAKKAESKKDEAKNVLHIQFDGKEYSEEDLFKIAKDVWKYDLNQKPEDLVDIELYVKPQDNAVYYVMNEEFRGSFTI